MPRFDGARERSWFRIDFGGDGVMRKVTRALWQEKDDVTKHIVTEVSLGGEWRQRDMYAIFQSASDNAKHLVDEKFARGDETNLDTVMIKLHGYKLSRAVADIQLDGAGWIEGVFVRELG